MKGINLFKSLTSLVLLLVSSMLWSQASLPVFTTNLDKTDLAVGFSHKGLGTNYTGPTLKFDSNDDYLILNFIGAPGELSFDLGASNNFENIIPETVIFSVEESADGVDYSVVSTYSGVAGGTQIIATLNTSTRYIKWIYTSKPSGTNMALKNISLTAGDYSCITAIHSFDAVIVNKTLSDNTFINAFNSENISTKTFVSSNTSVASVDPNSGETTLLAVGSSSISVSQAADVTYCALNDSYELIVSAAPSSDEPIAIAATNISSTGFTANWKTMSTATAYELNVYKKESASTVILSEDFSGFAKGEPNGSANNTDVSSNLDDYTQTAGWTGSKIYQAGEAAKMGGGSVLGYISTPSIDLSGNEISLSFKAMAWEGDKAEMKIFLDDKLIHEINDLDNYSYNFKNITVTISGGTPSSIIRFEAKQISKSRFFIDDILIYQKGNNIDISGSPFTVSGANSKSISGLQPNTDYYYLVRAITASGSSDPSNEISLRTSPSATPLITIAEETQSDMSAVANKTTDSETITVSAAWLTSNLNIAITGNDASMFSSSKSSIPTNKGIITNEQVIISYAPTTEGVHTATLTLSSAGAANVTRTVIGRTRTEAPTHHPTGFAPTATTQHSIKLSWTDALDANAYLIKASPISIENIAKPLNGESEEDGDLVKNIAQGLSTVTFDALTANSTYYFKIWPYNGTGMDTDIKYKTDGSVLTTNASTELEVIVSTPVATDATDITATTFTANWGTVSGASEYELHVYEYALTNVASDLFVSEYAEGSTGSKKYIEIYNGTGTAVDLSSYTIKKAVNGAGWNKTAYSFPDSEKLAHNSTFVLANNQIDVLRANDYNGFCSWNGNDAIGLFKDDVLIDVFGTADSDPGKGWTVAGIADATADHILIRKPSVMSPTTDWVASAGTTAEDSQWIVSTDIYSNIDQTLDLGSHSMDVGLLASPIADSPWIVYGTTSKTINALTKSTDYYYLVRARNSSSTSAYSNKINVTTIGDKIPTIVITELTLSDMSAVVNETTDSESITVSATMLLADIDVAIAGKDANMFSTNKSSIAANMGSVTNEQVTISYAPTTEGVHTATLTLSSAGAADVTRTLMGRAISKTPTHHPTAFTIIATTQNTIQLSWIDALDANAYLIKASPFGADDIAEPLNGEPENDGALTKNISQGIGMANFDNLTASTTYYFKIWPYNGSGTEKDTGIKYKTDETVLIASATTEAELDASIPIAGAASNITANSFTAHWSAVTDAREYELSIYTKTAGIHSSDLFISEYGEGSANNKYIEIYNGTGADINLLNYSLKQAYNGGGWDIDISRSLPLKGWLKSGDVYVLASAEADIAITQSANLLINANSDEQGGRLMTFTGNDAMALFKNGELIDIFGDPTSKSTIAVAGYASWGSDHSLVRKSTVTGPTADWAISAGTSPSNSQWEGYAKDTWTHIGTHTMAGSSYTTPVENSPFVTTELFEMIDGLSPATDYFYTVRAISELGINSATSNEIKVSTAPSKIVVSTDVDVSTLADSPTSDLEVRAGAKLTIDADKTFKSITLNPGAKLTLNDKRSLNGSLTLQSNATASASLVDNNSQPKTLNVDWQHLQPAANEHQYWYWSSPVNGAMVDIFADNIVSEYTESLADYSDPLSVGDLLTVGKGYRVEITSTVAHSCWMMGKTLNTGPIALDLYRTTKGPDNSRAGFNLVGNPYPSYLNWKMAHNRASNLRSSIWLPKSTGASSFIETYNASLDIAVPATASEYISPLQAFWVRVNAKLLSPETVTEGKLNLTNAMRSHGDTEMQAAPKASAMERQLIRLTVSNGQLSDEMVIATHPEATDDLDSYDSEKMSHGDEHRPEIYGLAGNTELVINALNSLNNGRQLALGFRTGMQGNYSIALAESTLLPDLDLMLHDSKKNLEWKLTSTNDYYFSSEGIDTNNRFKLSLRSKDSITDDNKLESKLLIYAQQGKMVIQSDSLAGASVSIFNVLGQTIFSAQAQSDILTIGNLPAGIYVLRVNKEVWKISLQE